MKVAVIDYGMGNLGSVRRALTELGSDNFVVTDPEQLSQADRIVLPGVGSFADGMAHLTKRGWIAEIRQQVVEMGKPFFGICLGMQLLATRGTEGGITPGLGLIDGEVVRIDTLGCKFRIPHVGWNAIELNSISDLFANVPEGTDFYFVHSYAFQPANMSHVLAFTDYGIPIVAAIGVENIFGTQFHPEKSSKAGFQLLRNFLKLGSC